MSDCCNKKIDGIEVSNGGGGGGGGGGGSVSFYLTDESIAVGS
ncbi:MAG: hypothetical protein ACRCZI_12380 [Cetobacterium sp.]